MEHTFLEQSDVRIAVISENNSNIEFLRTLVKDWAQLRLLDGKQEIIRNLQTEPADVLILDQNVQGLQVLELLKRIKEDTQLSHTPVLLILDSSDQEDIAEAVSRGVSDVLVQPLNKTIASARIKSQLQLARARSEQEQLLEKLRNKSREFLVSQNVAFLAMASLAETRALESDEHSIRISLFVRIIAEELSSHPDFQAELPKNTQTMMYRAAPLHDIGKASISDEILQKPGKLTDEEFEIMKKHTTYAKEAIESGEKVIGTNTFLSIAKDIVSSHHEKWDGSGYPSGLAGNDIPLAGRIMAIADVYDALISKKAYKPPFPHSRAVFIIEDAAGLQFDPIIAKVFSKVQGKFKEIALQYTKDEEMIDALNS
jgi:putative two-component system response regulator